MRRAEVAGLDQVAAEVARAASSAGTAAAGLLVGRAGRGGLPLVTGTMPFSERCPAGGDEVVGWYAIEPGGRAMLPPADERPTVPLLLILDPETGVEAAYAETAQGLVRLFHRPMASERRQPPRRVHAPVERARHAASARVPLAVVFLAGGAVGLGVWHVLA